jgi:ABC-2 type transport system ATP-binding protein
VESTATEIAILHKGHLKVRAQPEQLLKQMEGSVWEWTISSQDLPALKQQFLVSGTIRRMEGVEVRVVSQAQPSAQAKPVTPTLEDVYLAKVTQNHHGGSL